MAFIKSEDSAETPDLCRISITEDATIYCISDLKQSLNEALSHYQDVEINLGAVEEFDSAGVQLLLALSKTLKAQDKSLTLVESSQPVSDLLNTFGLNSQLQAGEAQ